MVFDSSALATSPYQPQVSAGGIASAQASSSGVAVETAQAVRETGPAYFSPRITYDNSIGMTILQLRDRDTGEVRNQYPSEHVVEEYRRHQVDGGAREAAPAKSRPSTGQGAIPTGGRAASAGGDDEAAPRVEVQA
ncbi:hypothetical protein DKG74_18335 [Zavarzinia aquatilis]|uniref:Uncharacterized protein n=2 Tax=Zavarzinia aquatilis TaxID=2211142 RepID=A0A317DXK7_9PROT|nr:hypothetical protein DKG74_18335 [Zavarzinia aquatilis]